MILAEFLTEEIPDDFDGDSWWLFQRKFNTILTEAPVVSDGEGSWRFQRIFQMILMEFTDLPDARDSWSDFNGDCNDNPGWFWVSWSFWRRKFRTILTEIPGDFDRVSAALGSRRFWWRFQSISMNITDDFQVFLAFSTKVVPDYFEGDNRPLQRKFWTILMEFTDISDVK